MAQGAYTRYYGDQTTFAGANDTVILDSINWQKPCTLLGIRVPAFTNEGDIDVHANVNGTEIWPPVGIECLTDGRFLPLMLNLPVGKRFQLLGDDGGANTPTVKCTAIVRVGELIGIDNIFLEGYQGTGVLANAVNRTFPVDAVVRWHNGIDGDVEILIGGFVYSGSGTGNALVVQGATLSDTDGINLGWPMPSGNALVVNSVTNQAYNGLFIMDLLR